MAEAPLEELEELVRTTGFYRNKALSLKETSKTLVEEFNGEVPKTMDELLTLRGAYEKPPMLYWEMPLVSMKALWLIRM